MDDELVLDYGPLEDEIPISRIRGSTMRHSKGRKCPECTGRFTNVRRHVITSHLPWYAAPLTACWECKLQFGQTSLLDVHITERHNNNANGKKFGPGKHQVWVELTNGLLAAICQNHQCQSPQDLCAVAEYHIKFEKNSEPMFQEDDLSVLYTFNSLNQYEAKDMSIKVWIPYTICSLLHWRILARLVSLTKNTDNLVSLERREPLETDEAENPVIKLVDSHFHLDMYTKKVRDNVLPSFSWTWGRIQYHISQLIANYCYPRNWPTSSARSEIRKDNRLSLTFGIHPRIVAMEKTSTLDSWMEQLGHMLNVTRVVAVGECGLDDTGLKERDIKKQEKYFKRQVELAVKKRLPIVIHCRGSKRTDERCLNCLAHILPSNFKMHRHCFNGEPATYFKWKSAFPNCKFGISPFILLDENYPDYRSLVCHMKLEDLIVETDAPYLHPSTNDFGSPLLLQDIVTKLANIFACSFDDVAETTTINALQLYNIGE